MRMGSAGCRHNSGGIMIILLCSSLQKDCIKNQAVLTAMGDDLDIIRKKSAEIAAGRREYDGGRCKCKN